MKTKIALIALAALTAPLLAQVPAPAPQPGQLQPLRRFIHSIHGREGHNYPNVILSPHTHPLRITPNDVNAADIIQIEPSKIAFEPEALTNLLTNPNKLLILRHCHYSAATFRKYGEDQAGLNAAYPAPDPKTSKTRSWDVSKGVGNQCDIIRIWETDLIPPNKIAIPEAERWINDWIAKAVKAKQQQ